jgi:hypothetical protein
VIGAYNHAQLLSVEMGVSLSFCPSCVWTTTFPVSTLSS